MTKDADVVRPDAIDPLGGGKGGSIFLTRQRLLMASRYSVKDAVAGLMASVVLIANIISFAALMFPGSMNPGISMAIWAMLIGSSIGGVWIALTTSLPPLATGIDSPTGAVLVLLSLAAGSGVLAAGGSPQAAVENVMLIFTAATFLTGALLFGLGTCRWGSYFRFVPNFVNGGFVGATGVLLLAGGVRMTTGQVLTLGSLGTAWPMIANAKLAVAVATLLVLLAVRRWSRFSMALPVALLLMWLTGTTVLRTLGLSGLEHGWYLPSLGSLTTWSPWAAVSSTHLTWSTIVGLVPELVAVTIVALISMVTKVSIIEVSRRESGSLDREFRAHGIANLLAAPCGGLVCCLQTATSRLLEHAGGATRMSGVVSALILGAVAIADFDLPALVPIPIIAGLVLYLGCTFIADALGTPLAQRAWLELLLVLFMMLVCIAYGYLVGVVIGLLCACVLFAINYARLGAVRRHLTRAMFTSNVDRSEEASQHLRQNGDAIHLYWLSGYVFFGSSERVFERVCDDIEAQAPRRVDYVILDFSMVKGFDSSAVASFAKLRNHCNKHGITLVYSALSPANRRALEFGGKFGGKGQHQTLADVNDALAWCEDQLLAEAKLDAETEIAGFETWVQQELGPHVSAAEFVAYLERKDAVAPQILYRQGEPADTIDLVAAGSLAVDVMKPDGESLRVRRMNTHTVLGEMGFYRRIARSATVSTTGPATIFTLSRENFERMRRERPDLAAAFDNFIVRVLAERVDATNRAIVALSG
jgi:sulfate permease, SulP family